MGGVPNKRNKREAGWTLVTANTTAWSSAQALIGFLADSDVKPDMMCLQETRLETAEANSAAAAWAAKQGLRLDFGAALSTGPGPLQNSGGTASGVKAHVGSAPVPISGVHASRATDTHMEGLIKGGVTVVSIYLHDGMGLLAENLEILQRLGQFLVQRSEPYIVAGDWNVQPEEMQAARWAEMVGGQLVTPDRTTCTSGKGSTLDWLVVSQELANFVDSVKVLVSAPTSPHSPVAVTF